MKKPNAKLSAVHLVKTILAVDSRVTKLAMQLDVHVNTVCRWRDGYSVPHPGHLKKLVALAALAEKSATSK
jgi:hypothetical protein